MSIATDLQYDDRAEFIARVQSAATVDGQSRAEALHAVAAVCGVPIGWHEAEVAAEALRHRYDEITSESTWARVAEWRQADGLAVLRKSMRRALVLGADDRGCALVDEPVEWVYAAPARYLLDPPADDERGRTPLTAAQVAALPDDYYVLLKLVGHAQKLDR